MFMRNQDIERCLAQNLAGLTKLAVLPLQSLHLRGDNARQSGALASIDFRLPDSIIKRMRRAANLGRIDTMAARCEA